MTGLLKPTDEELAVVKSTAEGRVLYESARDLLMSNQAVQQRRFKIRQKYYAGAPNSSSMVYMALLLGHLPYELNKSDWKLPTHYAPCLVGVVLGMSPAEVQQTTGITVSQNHAYVARMKNALVAKNLPNLILRAFITGLLPMDEERMMDVLGLDELPSWCHVS